MCRRRVCAAALLAAASFVCVFCAGLPRSARASDEDEIARILLFSGRDLWRNGAFAHGGFLFGPNGFDADGLLIKLMQSGGVYRYNAGNLGGARVIGAESVTQILPGFLVKRGAAEIKIFAGPEYQVHWLWPDDPGNKLRGSSFGLRFAVDVWAEPWERGMVAADASFSTIGGNFSGRAAIGWRVLERFFAGPETQVYGGDGYRQTRFGGHITSMKTDDTEWSAAAGWAVDTDSRSGAYVRIGILQRP